jgi:hypothetical protein
MGTTVACRLTETDAPGQMAKLVAVPERPQWMS